MQYRLGLDLGASSLGWAVVEVKPGTSEDGSRKFDPVRLLDAGVRIFDAGVEGDIESGKDSSKAVKRREARGPRRQTWRRQRRARKLFRILAKHGLLPDEGDYTSEGRNKCLKKLDAELRSQWIQEGDHKAAQELPYLLRAKAVEEPLNSFPKALGRALYHLAQRRGYLSNRKSGESNTEKSQVLSSIKQQEDEKGNSTFAQYAINKFKANEIDPEWDHIRRRWTSRLWHLEEFERIKATQSSSFPNLTENDWLEIKTAIFHQRPLKSSKHLIGKCSLETKNGKPYRRRCAEARPAFQEFRIIQAVNNLMIETPFHKPAALNQQQRQKLIDKLMQQQSLSWAKARALIGYSKNDHFTIEETQKELIGHRTGAKIRGVIGEQWDEFSAEQQDQLTLELLYYEKPSALKRRLQQFWNVTEEQAENLASLQLEAGYGRLSHRAISRLLPHMQNHSQMGMTYAEARKKEYPDSFREQAVDFLEPVRTWDADLKNPAVIRALTELRKIVNAILKRYNGQKPVSIHIELARELKNNRESRKEMTRRNQLQRRRREAVKEKLLKEFNREPNRRDIEKLMLAEECNMICPYTGKPIELNTLFNGTFDVEHIFPRKYLDDSFLNKTICHHDFNRNHKGNRMPSEVFDPDSEDWQLVLQRVGRFSGDAAKAKLRKFKTTPDQLGDDFTSRHLNDTRYSSRVAAQYLLTLFGDKKGDPIIPVAGTLTGLLRGSLQANGILAADNKKHREEHLHHAVDALLVALTDRSMIQKASENAAHSQTRGLDRFVSNIQQPWPEFIETCREIINLQSLHVSHRQTHTLAGPLHAESFYSKPYYNEDGKPEYRIRKALDKLSVKEITSDKIVDPKIRALVQQKFADIGSKQPSQAFADVANHPVMKSQSGREIPIHKVRVKVSKVPRSIGQGHRERKVASGGDSNFAAMIYAELDAKGKVKKWKHEVITRLDAHRAYSRNHKKKGEKVLIPQETETRKFVMSLCKNDCLLLTGPDGDDVLYRVSNISVGEIQLWEHYVGVSNPKARNTWNRITSIDSLRKRNARKVAVSPLGETKIVVNPK